MFGQCYETVVESSIFRYWAINTKKQGVIALRIVICIFYTRVTFFFVPRCNAVSQDVKPGVSMVRRVKEAMKREEKQKEKNIKNRQKSYKEQESESREAALQSSISNENKGFALLQKMGYKAGQGLGKQGKFILR